uniref:Integrin subunit alpha E n=1 Tax=Varanus komodoensis TaxID=61221 RepID=A0A8D2L8J0_VARKO
MMETFYEKCLECVFALVQYGYIIQTEFDLQVDKASALRKVRAVKQVGNVTRTASAMQHVLDSIFSASHGSQKKSDKIILVLTDGEILMDELDLKTVISSSEMAGIERYAIGVGEAFNRMNPLQELRLIASDPDESHLFRVTNYSALNVLLSTLEQKFFQIEGMAGNILEFELAESGFSVHFPDEKNILFGAVGAFDWSGGVLLHNPAKGSTVFLNESKEATDARNGYLGNSPSTGDTLMVAGAPRRGMTGRVLVFEDVHLKQSLNGTQVGSYYGSEFCLLDINQDGITDYLLVGAPFFHVHGEEGKVYLYHFDKETKLFSSAGHLAGDPSFPFARFGFAMAAIGDIDANGFGDVAIGAPLEGHEPDSGSSGSIYIFNGGKDGIHSSFSQVPSHLLRITAAQTGVAGLMYFGRSVAGGLDFTEDGLLDLVVGSLGNVILFCFSLPHPDSFQPCTDDCFSNITLRLSYRLHASETDLSYPSAMLDFYQVSEVYFQVRSETRPPCPSCLETACLLHLKQEELVVGFTKELEMNIYLANRGGGSYLTYLVLQYPANLHMKNILKVLSQISQMCPGVFALFQSPLSPSLPVVTQAHFSVIWQLDGKRFPGSLANLTVSQKCSFWLPVQQHKQGQADKTGIQRDFMLLIELGDFCFKGNKMVFLGVFCVVEPQDVAVGGVASPVVRVFLSHLPVNVKLIIPLTLEHLCISGKVTVYGQAVPLQPGEGIINNVHEVTLCRKEAAGLPDQHVPPVEVPVLEPQCLLGHSEGSCDLLQQALGHSHRVQLLVPHVLQVSASKFKFQDHEELLVSKEVWPKVPFSSTSGTEICCLLAGRGMASFGLESAILPSHILA